MTFNDLFEFCPTPMLLTDINGVIIESNSKTRELAGFKNKKEAFECHYSRQPCDISDFSNDFILQDNLAFNSPNPIQFISMYRFIDTQFHVHLGTKSKTKDGLILTNMMSISNVVSPFLVELLKLHSTQSTIDKERGFTYLFPDKNKLQTIFSKQELHCIKFLSRSLSSKLIAKHMGLSHRTIEGYIENIKNKLGLDSKHNIIEHCLRNNILTFDNLFN